MGPNETTALPRQSRIASRRHFLGATMFLATAAGELTRPKPLLADAPLQSEWRFCNKCEVLFYNGFPTKGRCAAGGAHVAQGFTFLLPHDVGETPSAQRNWRFCSKCEAMFFDGFPTKGTCPAGGSHFAQGFNFVLPHDMPETPVAQRHWRFCNKCEAMFFNGFPNKGRCAAGGIHVAQGFNFVLAHPTYGCAHCNDGSCQCGYGTGGQLCATHGRDDPSIGCVQQP